jgi:putative PIN family toxin of toxin-antitoxin system
MRIVLDANVLARGAPGSTGLAREIVDRSTNPPHLLVFSAESLAELGRVMRYPRLKTLHGLADSDIDDFVSELWSGAAKVSLPIAVATIVKRDPSDDPIVATAVNGAADALCTRDQHILGDAAVIGHCAAHGVRVVTDIELIQLLRQP